MTEQVFDSATSDIIDVQPEDFEIPSVDIGRPSLSEILKAGVLSSSVKIMDKIESVGDRLVHAKEDLISAMTNLACGANIYPEKETNLTKIAAPEFAPT